MNKPKFEIGQTVYNAISKRGSYEPSTCQPYTALVIDKVEKHGDTFEYTCGFDGYCFVEDELMSAKEYAEHITRRVY